MSNINLSWYIKLIRKYSKNCRQSYQNILSILFGIIGSSEDYFVESSTSSRIMNREYDVPYDIREKYNAKNDENKLLISNEFINKLIDVTYLDSLIKEIKSKISDSNISFNVKDKIINSNNYRTILSDLLSIVIITDNRNSFNEILYKNNNGIIKLINGDLIAMSFNKKLTKKEKIVVIPVDNKFTLVINDLNGNNIISKDSLHGKWITRMQKEGIEKPKIKYIKDKNNFKIGKIIFNNTIFYLLPVSTLKERYKAESNKEMIINSLNALASEYSISSNGLSLYLPLIGTGRSRTKLTLIESINLIKDTFINNKDGFYGEVNIVIYNKNIEELEDLECIIEQKHM